MSKLVAKVAERLAADLEPGEQVLAATKAQLAGGTVRIGTSVATGGTADAGLGDGELARGAIVAVTDRRILFVKVTTATFQPERLVLAVPFSSLERVELGTKRLMLVKMSTITLHPTDGPAVEFEVPRVNARDAQAVVEAVHGAGVA